MRPITATATPAKPQVMIRLDTYHGAACGVQVNPSGGASFTIDCSFDTGPDDLTNPIPLASMAWDSSMIPPGAVQGINSFSFGIPTAPVWARLTLLNGVGSVRATFVQYSQHHSVIPSKMPDSQMLSLPTH